MGKWACIGLGGLRGPRSAQLNVRLSGLSFVGSPLSGSGAVFGLMGLVALHARICFSARQSHSTWKGVPVWSVWKWGASDWEYGEIRG
jgi:hypothetical protein